MGAARVARAVLRISSVPPSRLNTSVTPPPAVTLMSNVPPALTEVRLAQRLVTPVAARPRPALLVISRAPPRTVTRPWKVLVPPRVVVPEPSCSMLPVPEMTAAPKVKALLRLMPRVPLFRIAPEPTMPVALPPTVLSPSWR